MSFAHHAGHFAAAFLAGIALHSIRPYIPIPQLWLLIAISISGGVGLVLYKETGSDVTLNYISRICLIICFVLLGVYRFSLAQPSLPRGLIFADPKGFATSNAPGYISNRFDPRYWLTRLHKSLTQRARERFVPDEAALITGILYGDRNLSKAAKTAFRHAGLTHIIAVSGSNMTIIVVVVARCLALFHLSRRQSFIGMVIGVILFTVFVGASAAVVRAAIMGILVQFAPLAGRLIRPSRLLLISALGFTLWHPWALFFDASFALSFLAMTGLLTYGRLIDTVLTKYISSEMLREIVTSTLAATILTTPYGAWAFGSFTLWGLPTGLIVLPLIPWTMGLGALALVIPTASVWCQIITLPASGCLWAILAIARWPERIKFGYLDKTYLPLAWLIVAYLIIWMLHKIIHSLQTAEKAVITHAQIK
ncbi:ComEC/Rec2 family competence protein [Patescibacteria group bacterium]|nr:ComEC/Rec2 family competence protein [Patescibacteria group bacterium]MBP9709851.1 ComEC/Rec2 family competence protein [Patescibacteria group bacterium]